MGQLDSAPVVGLLLSGRPADFTRLFADFRREVWVASRSIVYLFLRGRPAAIVGFVIAVVVDAVESHANRPFTHVFKERLKVQPSVANRDSASAVSLETSVVCVRAPPLHASPGIIGWGSRAPMRSGDSSPVMAAIRYAPPAQVGEICDSRSAAVTFTEPTRLAVLVSVRKMERGEEPEALSRDVSECGHEGTFPCPAS